MEKRLNIWVSENLLRRTKAQAALEGCTLKRMVTLALEEFLDAKASMARKRIKYLKRKHKKEDDIRVDNGKMLALLSELTMEEGREEPQKEMGTENVEIPSGEMPDDRVR